MSSFLEEDNGTSSLIRLIPFILTIACIAFGFLGIVLKEELAIELSQSFLVAITGTLGVKAYQKQYEESTKKLQKESL